MAHLARLSDFHASAPTPARRGFWRALIDAVIQSHRNDARREIDAYVARRGKLTDNMEREIADRYVTGHWGSRF